MESTEIFYIYVFLDTRKPGEYVYDDFKFDFEPFYLGVSNTNSYYVREEVHIRYAKLKKDVCNNKYKMNIINKIIKSGKEPLSIRIIEGVSKEFAFQKEAELIEYFGTRFNGTGPLVNISVGGLGGDTFTNNPRKEEIREKHRQNALGPNNHMWKRPLERSPSHLSKLTGQHWNKGRKASEESKERMRQQRGGAKNSTAKKTLLFDSSFEIVKEFGCCLDVSHYIGASKKAAAKTALTNSRSDIPYHTTKGYYIIYKDDWVSRFESRQLEIKEFLKNFKKNKNQHI